MNSPDSLKVKPILDNYLTPPCFPLEISVQIIILEKILPNFNFKAYQLKNDKILDDYQPCETQLIFLGEVNILNRPEKKILLLDDTLIRYEKLVITSSSQEQSQIISLQNDFNSALKSLLDAIKVSKNVDTDSFYKGETNEGGQKKNSFCSNLNSSLKSLPPLNKTSEISLSLNQNGKRNFEWDF